MTTVGFITELFCRIDDQLAQADKEQKHGQLIHPLHHPSSQLLGADLHQTCPNPDKPEPNKELACHFVKECVKLSVSFSPQEIPLWLQLQPDIHSGPNQGQFQCEEDILKSMRAVAPNQRLS